MTPSSSPITASDLPGPDAPPARALFWLAVAALAVSALTVLGMTAYSRGMQAWVEHTTRMYQITRSGLLDVAGPLPRGDSAALAAFRLNARTAIARFDTVGDSTRDPVQMARVRTIRELAGQWSSALRDRPAAAPGLAAAIDVKVQEFLAEEQRLYDIRSERFHRALGATAITVTIELAFVAMILVAYSRRIARDARIAAEQQRRLEDQATELEEQALALEISNQELREAMARTDDERANAPARGTDATGSEIS